LAIELKVRSDSRQAQADLRKLNKSVDNISATTTNMARNLQRSVTALTAGIAGIVALKGLTNITDRFTLIENRIALVTGRTKELNTTFKELQEVAIRSRGSLVGIADLYNRLGRSTKALGVSNGDVIKVTETIQKAIVISGASAESANAAIVQLGQGLAAGALRGQELNSVMEQTPRVAAAIAAELGVGVGGLRKLAEQGKITSEVVVRAFQSQRSVIEKEFGAVNATVGEGFSMLAQGASLMTREFIAGTGATDALAQKLLNVGTSLTRTAPMARKLGENLRNFLFAPLPKEGLFGDLFTTAEEKMSGFQRILNNLGVYTAISAFTDMGDKILSVAMSIGDTVLPKIEAFVEKVSELFYWVYMRVVGNSYWPDMIKEVTEWAVNGFNSALNGVKAFTSNVVDLFSSLVAAIPAQLKSGLAAIVIGIVGILGSSIGAIMSGIGVIVAGALGVIFTQATMFALAIGSIVGAVKNTDDLSSFVAQIKELGVALVGIAAVGFAGLVSTAVTTLGGLGSVIAGLGQSLLVNFSIIIIGITQIIDSVLLKQLPDSVRDVSLAIMGGISGTILGVTAVLVSSLGTFITAASAFIITQATSLAARVLIILDAFREVTSIETFVGALKELARGMAIVTGATIVGTIYALGVALAGLASVIGQSVLVALLALGGMFETIADIANEKLPIALQSVKEFGTKVKDVFWDIYDRVVGNSYWPDMVDGVVDYTSNLFKSLFVVESFGTKVTKAFKNVLGKVQDNLGGFKESLGEVLAVAIAGVSIGLSGGQAFVAGVGFAFIQQLSKGLDFIRDEFPRVYDIVAASAATFLVSKISKLRFLTLPLIIGSAVATGLTVSAVTTAISEFGIAMGNSLGRAIGAFIINLPELAVRLAVALVESVAQFGEAFLRQIPLIGNAIASIPLTSILVGSFGAAFIAFNWGNTLFGGIFKTAVEDAGGLIARLFNKSLTVDQSKEYISGLLDIKVIGKKAFESVKSGVAKASVAIRAYIERLKTADKVQQAVNTTAGISIPAWKRYSLAVMANTKAFLANNLAIAGNFIRGKALAYGMVASQAATIGLTKVVQILTISARAMWIAVTGPIGVIVAGIALLVAAFRFLTKNTDDLASKIGTVGDASKTVRNDIANFFGMGVDLKVRVTHSPAETKAVFKSIEEGNRETLFRMKRDADGSFIFDFMDNISTSIKIGLTSAFISVRNGLVDFANAGIQAFNLMTNSGVTPFVRDTRTAVETMLDDMDTSLRIGVTLDGESFAKDLEEFGDDAMKGLFVATADELIRLEGQLAKAEDGLFNLWGFWKDTNAIEKANGLIAVQKKKLDSVTRALYNQVKARKLEAGIKAGYEERELHYKSVITFYGEELVKLKSIADLQRLSNSEQAKYNSLIGQTEAIMGTIRAIQATTEAGSKVQNDRIAEQLKLLDGVKYLIGQIGKVLKTQTDFDLATALGIDPLLVKTFTQEALAEITKAQQEIIDKEKEIANLRALGASAAVINRAQLELTELQRSGDVLLDGTERGMLSVFDKVISDLEGSDVALDLSQLIDLPKGLQGRVQKYADDLRKINVQLESVLNNPELKAKLQKDAQDLSKEFGDKLNTDIAISQLDNFSRALKPFKDLGVNFNADDFADLGKKASAPIIAQATLLAEERKEIEDRVFKETVAGQNQRIAAVAAFNEKVVALEEAARKAVEDKLLNEKVAEELAGNFGSAVTDALHGKSDFGDSMASIITNHLQKGMTDRIASFAEGFLDSFFGAFEGKGGIGGGLAEMLRGPDNEEKGGLEAAGGSILSGFGGGDSEGEKEDITALPAKGLEKLTGSVAQADAGILGWLGSVGSSIASALGFGTATAVASGTTATAATTTLTFTTALSLATSALMQLAAAATTASATQGFSFFSTGGYVRGAGTGTSDSIPAMLSNGEYVINAKATKRNGALIKAINEGADISRFSTGGQVGNSLPVMSMESQSKRMSSVAPAQAQSTTVNLQVTGDVTEATRKAVRDMGNELSQQVEGNFRERGVLNG